MVYPDKSTSNDYFQWSDDETLQFLNWMEKQFLPTQTRSLHDESDSNDMTIDQKIARRKLYKIFPLDPDTNHDSDEAVDSKHQLTFIEDLQEKYAKQQSFLNNNNNNRTVHFTTRQDIHLPTRKEAVNSLMTQIASQLSVDFAISEQQLKDCIYRLKKACIHKMN